MPEWCYFNSQERNKTQKCVFLFWHNIYKYSLQCKLRFTRNDLKHVVFGTSNFTCLQRELELVRAIRLIQRYEQHKSSANFNWRSCQFMAKRGQKGLFGIVFSSGLFSGGNTYATVGSPSMVRGSSGAESVTTSTFLIPIWKTLSSCSKALL